MARSTPIAMCCLGPVRGVARRDCRSESAQAARGLGSVARRSGRTRILALSLCLAASLCAGQGRPAPEAKEFADFRLPDYDENGVLRAEVRGEKGVLLPDGRLDVTNLRMVFYEDGVEAMRISAPRCVYDRQTQIAESDTAVLVEARDMRLSGVGFRFMAPKRQLRVFRQTKLVLRSVREQFKPEDAP